jgi:hypothetical protein
MLKTFWWEKVLKSGENLYFYITKNVNQYECPI